MLRQAFTASSSRQKESDSTLFGIDQALEPLDRDEAVDAVEQRPEIGGDAEIGIAPPWRRLDFEDDGDHGRTSLGMRHRDLLQEDAVLAQDELFAPRELVVFAAGRIGGEPRAIGLVRGEAVDVVGGVGGGQRAFVRARNSRSGRRRSAG